MSGLSGYSFIGPLKPGTKPPAPPSPGEYTSPWTVLDLLNDYPSSYNDDHHGHSSSSTNKSTIGKIKKPKKIMRAAGGTTWEDPTLAEWDSNDYRVFCGDLGNDVTDELLVEAFQKYPSFVKAKVVRDKRTGKSRGFGFISFKDPLDYAQAIKEWDGKYLGCRPIKLRKSNWKDRTMDVKKTKIPGIIPEQQP